MANAKVAITAENKMSPGLLQAKKAMMEFQQTVNKVGSTLKSAFGITTAIVAVKKLADGVADSFKAFSEAERKYKQLSITLGNGKAFESVKQNIKDLSKLTLSSKDDIESMVSQMAGMGKSAEDINAISEAAVYLSNITGKDLNTSMQTLLKTYNGTDASLKKMGIDTGELTKEELKNGAAVQAIIDKYGELSRSMAEADNSQHLQNIKNNFGDIKQSIGDLVSFAITPLIGQVDAFSEKLLTSVDDFVQKTKVVLGNLPEVMSRLWDAFKGGLAKLFSVEGIKNLVDNLMQHVLAKVKMLGNVVGNLGNLVSGVLQEAIQGVGNYAMYWITSICDRMGVDISGVINTIGQWLTESPIGKIIDKVVTTAVNGIRLVGALIKNVPDMVKLVADNIKPIVSNIFTSLKNVFFSTLSNMFGSVAEWLDRVNFPQMIENVKVSIQNVFGRIGGWFAAVGSTAKDTFRYIGEILSATFSWNSIKPIFTTVFKNIGVIASTVIKEIFVNIPSMIASLFEGIGKWIAYMAVLLKNTLLESIQGFINDAGKKIQGTWVGKVFGLGDKLANVDFGIDKTGENNLKAGASAAFANIGAGFQKAISDAIDAAATIKENNKAISALYDDIDGISIAANSYQDITAAIKDSGAWVDALQSVSDALGSKFTDNSEQWQEIGAKFSALLNPVFEKFVSDNSETIGQSMAVWTAKSTDEYYKAAKQNFSNIGDFLEDWGKTFLSDLGDDWSDVTDSFKSIFGDAFGEDFDGFLAWFKPFMETNLKKDSGSGSGGAGGGGGGGPDADSSSEKNPTFLDNFANKIGEKLNGVFGQGSSAWAAGASSALDGLTSSFGQAGTLVKELATNMATMGPVIGAIVTALKYVLEGFAEVISGPLNDFVQYGLEPLREIGRVIGEVLLPLFDALMPLVEESARFLIGLFDSIGIVLKPIVQMIGALLTPTLSVLTNVLKMLEPVIKFLSKVLVTVTGTIQYVVQVLQHWVAVVMNWLADLEIFGWHPFDVLRMEDPGSPGKYGHFIQNKWGEIDAAFDKGVTSGTSTATSISSAGYQGATQIVINIYQQAPVVGDGGMRQFASMIRDEFSNLDYYGVTA